MISRFKTRTFAWLTGVALTLVAGSMFVFSGAQAQNKEPIKIGFSMSLTGPLSANGKQALLGMQIWEEETNAKGGLLGRPVKLIYYDDKSTAAEAPGIYTKLLDVDKVDLILGPYATVPAAAAMTVAVQRKKVFQILFGLDVNSEFKYDRFFAMIPTGPNTKPSFTEGFFEAAAQQNPKPQTVALAFADAEFAQNACEGARVNAKKHGIKVIYDKSYPPATVDYSPIVRAIQATNPDVVLLASYPPDSVGMVRAATEIGLRTQLFGGAMVGMQYASLIGQLSEKLNRVVNYHFFVPSPKMSFPGIEDFLKKYQARAKDSGVDPLGFYQPPFAYAAMQILEQAIKATGTLDDDKLADYIHKNTFKTIVGDVRFNELGEWADPRVIMVQFQNIQGAGLEQYMTGHKQVIVYPNDLKDGDLEYPFSK